MKTKCDSSNTVKNGHTHYGKQCFKCQNCRRQFVESPTR
ncbi:MAG: IS1/IS1595 family N-terminal zinc-binding domain-containing protein [Nostoc sp. CmiSLP01]